MNQTLASQNIATIGTFLTLTSLLGTFFYVQLSTWLGNLLTLQAKFEVHKNPSTPEDEKAMREVHYTLKGLFNTLPFLVACTISFFIGFAAWHAFEILQPYRGVDPLAGRLAQALTVFLTIYGILVVYLLVRGYLIGAKIKKGLG